MTINEYLNGLKENMGHFKSNDGRSLADVMADSVEIWNNDACRGYLILAMEKAGIERETIKEVLKKESIAFDDYTIEEAEKYYIKW